MRMSSPVGNLTRQPCERIPESLERGKFSRSSTATRLRCRQAAHTGTNDNGFEFVRMYRIESGAIRCLLIRGRKKFISHQDKYGSCQLGGRKVTIIY
jgi:hypothetical protein